MSPGLNQYSGGSRTGLQPQQQFKNNINTFMKNAILFDIPGKYCFEVWTERKTCLSQMRLQLQLQQLLNYSDWRTQSILRAATLTELATNGLIVFC